jgi:pseudouridine synthase
MEERLQKFLARAGIASRRAAEELMRQGRVTVNGEPAVKPGIKIDPGRDAVKVDGKRVTLRRSAGTYIMLNKPRGYLTTVSDPEGRPTVMDLAPRVRARIYPVGRLDFQTEGLLLLTDDGDLASSLMHPSRKVPKTYRAKVRGVPSRASLQALRGGIVLEGKRTQPARIRMVRRGENNAWLELQVTEGRKHLIRKMLEKIGHPVLRLRRTAYGGLGLGDLGSGECRRLAPGEVDVLRRSAGLESSGRRDTGERADRP